MSLLIVDRLVGLGYGDDCCLMPDLGYGHIWETVGVQAYDPIKTSWAAVDRNLWRDVSGPCAYPLLTWQTASISTWMVKRVDTNPSTPGACHRADVSCLTWRACSLLAFNFQFSRCCFAMANFADTGKRVDFVLLPMRWLREFTKPFWSGRNQYLVRSPPSVLSLFLDSRFSVQEILIMGGALIVQ